MLYKILQVFIIFSICYSCKKKEETIPLVDKTISDNCIDTMYVSYTKQIQPILNANCVRCHDAATGQNFTTYKTTKPFAEAGILQGCIDGDPNFILMPPSNSKKMNSCDINKIHAWVRQGMKDN